MKRAGPGLTRREAIALGLGASVAACAGAPPPRGAGEAETLDALARRSGRRFGSAVGSGPPGRVAGAFADPRYRDLVARECGLIVHENELKWTWIRRRGPEHFDFEPADRILAFAEENGLRTRGHTLLWHHPRWLPSWLATHDFGPRPAAAAEQMLREHVGAICRRYGARIHSYDVVNETVDNVSGAMRETPFTRVMGGAEPVVDATFHTAREAAPHAQLVYNDYMTWTTASAAHRDGVLRLLEGFRRRNVPVDALGVQAHLGAGTIEGGPGTGPLQEAEWRRFLDAVVAMGFDLLITEFDVNDRDLPADFAARDRAVADHAGAYLDLMLSYDRLGDILAWGMSDRYSWLQNITPRADGLAKRCCPYDADFRPKPLRAAIAASLRNAASQYRRA